MNIAPRSFTQLQVTIRELAVLVAEMVGYTGTLKFDTTRLDGAPLKLLGLSRLSVLEWISRIQLREGLVHAYQDFLVHRAAVGQSSPAGKA